MTNADIRKTMKEDLEALGRVAAETELFPPEMLPDLVAPALASNPEVLWLTACVDGQPCGFCFAEAEALADRVWNMRALAVTPSLQGRGVGSALVAELETLLRDAGQRMLLVDTSGMDGFARTRAFYDQSAYEREARLRDYWGEGDDKITYRKVL